MAYRLKNTNSYTTIDEQLIQGTSATIVGLSAGEYDVQLLPVIGDVAKKEFAATGTASVTAYDRSGYAHFGASEGVGAYTSEGLLKSNAVVLYVDDATKNTVSALLAGKTYTGLVAILQAAAKSTSPLVVRIKGALTTNQFAAKSPNGSPYNDPSYYENSLETLYSENLKGLSCSAIGPAAGEAYWAKTVSHCASSGYVFNYSSTTSSSATDNCFNNCSVSLAKNVTIEGVTPDASIEQWGLTWSKCNSIEVRNLLFENYVEDACSFQGGKNSDMDYARFWLHHCRFNRGLNHWDLTSEQDKSDGDGAVDIKYLKNITLANNVFSNTHKTGLIGGSDSAYTMNVTFHHNYYEKCSARLPIGRRANIHLYNNYYWNCTTCQDIRAYAYCFSEANAFQSCKNPQLISSNAAIKSFGDLLTSCGTSGATVVSDRTKEVSNSCKPDGSSDYSAFTTSSTLFYYDAANKRSDVTLLLKAADVATYVVANAGPSLR